MSASGQSSTLRHYPLGQRMPDSPHAVCVSLPTMADVDNREDLDQLRHQLMSNDQDRLLNGLNRILADGEKETTKE